MVKVPRVSVIIPVYNRERYVAETLNSVMRQTYGHVETIIVNDGSTDGSAKQIQAYLRYPNVKYLEQNNQGPAVARNAGITDAAIPSTAIVSTAPITTTGSCGFA